MYESITRLNLGRHNIGHNITLNILGQSYNHHTTLSIIHNDTFFIVVLNKNEIVQYDNSVPKHLQKQLLEEVVDQLAVHQIKFNLTELAMGSSIALAICLLLISLYNFGHDLPWLAPLVASIFWTLAAFLCLLILRKQK